MLQEGVEENHVKGGKEKGRYSIGFKSGKGDEIFKDVGKRMKPKEEGLTPATSTMWGKY